MDKINVLVSLTKGYGLGDAVQMSVVLRHIRKYRPHWILDFQAEQGRESVGRGIAHNVFTYGEGPLTTYDAEVQIVLYDTMANWTDRPNTRVVSCLREKFDIEWDKQLSRYEINVPRDTYYAAKVAFSKWTAGRQALNMPIIALHYKGDSAPDAKNLSEEQATRICDKIRELNRFPLVLDWRGKLASPYGGYADWNCAVISQCEAFVGIDSGPGKCASATETPSLIVWLKHDPALYHDPAPNTVHLVPADYHNTFFEANYRVLRYVQDPISEVEAWLNELLS